MAISCCRYCVAPKRYPGCHGKCPDYSKEKAKHDAEKAERDKRKRIEYNLDSQLAQSIYKKMRISHKKG